MPTVKIPVTTYSIRKIKPTQPYGSPAEMPLKTQESRILARVALDAVPLNATITSAILRMFTSRAYTGAATMTGHDVTSPWKASVTWSSQPTYVTLNNTVTVTNPPARQAYDLVVTSWAITRSRKGLLLGTGTLSNFWIAGSAAARDKPVLIVTYTLPPDKPGALVPNGGAVSVQSPILTYAGDEDMTQQKIEYSSNGSAVSFATAFLPATEGYLDQASVAGSPVQAVDVFQYWRAITLGPDGQSVPSDWASYDWRLLPVAVITSPGGTAVPPSNPSFETNTTGWTTSGGATIARDTTLFQTGVASGKITWAAGAAYTQFAQTIINTVVGGEYVVSMWLRSAVGTPRLALQISNGGVVVSDVIATANGTWQRVSLAFIATATTSAVNVYNADAATVGQVANIDLLEVYAGGGGTTPDGSPVLQWVVTPGTQEAWRAEFWSGSTLIDSSGWRSEPLTRNWTPGKSIKVPDGVGRFILWVRDTKTPRVAATNAPTQVRTTRDFTTTLVGAGTAINTLVYTYDEPVSKFSGTRTAGVPDEVSLFRDGVQVPLWAADGSAGMWMPGVDFFTGTSFQLSDFTADPRHTHIWQVRVRVNGVVSAQGPTVTSKPYTRSAWLVDPRTGTRIEILGYGEEPAIEQETIEQSILHVPISGGQIVEPKRRRLMRTTRAGSISGMVQDLHEATLDEWSLGDSGAKYRLVFGKVNWSVIIGDYNPVDLMAYPKGCGSDKVLFSLNWWQRLADV